MVKLKDRNKDLDFLRIVLSAVDIGISYECCELVTVVQAALKIKGGDLSLMDVVKIRREWEEKWDKYHEDNKMVPPKGK